MTEQSELNNILHKAEESFAFNFFNFKKKSFSFNRKAFYCLFALFFLSPFLVISSYFFFSFDKTYAPWFFSLFFALGVSGAFFLLRQMERAMAMLLTKLLEAKIEKLQQRSQGDLEEENCLLKKHMDSLTQSFERESEELAEEMRAQKEKIELLKGKIEEKTENIRQAYLEYEDLRREYERLEEGFERAKKQHAIEIEQKDTLQQEYQNTVVEQRAFIEKNKRYITKLESKVTDLTDEIKNLLQIEAIKNVVPEQKSVAFSPIEQLPLPEKLNYSPFDLSQLLQKYVRKAENFLGANHLGVKEGGRSRFLDISLDNFTLDLRRFFDYFRDETTGIIFFFSLADNKMLFANNFVKDLLGWSPEKFQKEFFSLLVTGASEWKKSLSRIDRSKEEEFRVLLKSKQGEEKQFRCLLGLINTPPFNHHLMGIFSPIEH